MASQPPDSRAIGEIMLVLEFAIFTSPLILKNVVVKTGLIMQVICVLLVPFVLHLLMALCKLDEPPCISFEVGWNFICVSENSGRVCKVLHCHQQSCLRAVTDA